MRSGALVVLTLLCAASAHLQAQKHPWPIDPYSEYQVQKRAVLLNGMPTVPLPAGAENIGGEVVVQVIVTDAGRVAPASVQILRATSTVLADAVRIVVPTLRFAPAELDGKAVPQMVQVPFVFAGSGTPPGDGLKPGVVRFGATLAEMQKSLAGLCAKLTTRRIDPPLRVLRDIEERQFQIDCEGFEFRGKPRHAQFIVADDRLELVWIMTERSEGGLLHRLMESMYGEPERSNDKFFSFARGRAALRIDVAEVLFYSERLAPRVAGWFGPNSTF